MEILIAGGIVLVVVAAMSMRRDVMRTEREWREIADALQVGYEPPENPWFIPAIIACVVFVLLISML
jgi:hypothetical protein